MAVKRYNGTAWVAQAGYATATTAASANTLVQRDASGNITASSVVGAATATAFNTTDNLTVGKSADYTADATNNILSGGVVRNNSGTPTVLTETYATRDVTSNGSADVSHFVRIGNGNISGGALGVTALQTIYIGTGAIFGDTTYNKNNVYINTTNGFTSISGTVSLPSTTSIGGVSATEIGYLDGVTDSIQTQLGNKANTTGPTTFTGTTTVNILNATTVNATTVNATTVNATTANATNVQMGGVTATSAATNNALVIRNATAGATFNALTATSLTATTVTATTVTATNVVATSHFTTSGAVPLAVSTAGTITLTIANLINGLITVATNAAVTLTLPTGTLTDAGVLGGAAANFTFFEWAVVNTGTVSGAVTIAAGTAHTITGSTGVPITTSARFRTVKQSASTYITYRT
jgi:hypothetical protein